MEKKEVRKWQDEEALRRYRMIAPLLDPDPDAGKRQQLRGESAEKNGISKRTLYRYEKGCREEGFEGLRPASRTKKRQQRLPENFEEIMGQAVQLKREVPGRSVRQIIKVLELEGWAAPGVLRPSTKAVLKAGKSDCAYLDNGVQYTADHLGKACAKLGIRLVHAKPGACQSKG